MLDRLPRGLALAPLAVRTRMVGPAAEGALHKGYDVWSPLQFYFSEFRARYLAGEVKGVMTSIRAQHALVYEAFSIVPVAIPDRAAVARRHRDRLLEEIQFHYKNAVARSAAAGAVKVAKRKRHAANRAHETIAPTIDAVDRHFAGYPEAIAEASEIKALWSAVREARSR